MSSFCRLFYALFAVSLLTGCATTRMTSTWTDENYKGQVLDQIFVIGVSSSEGSRRSFEDRFVEGLAEIGIEASASHTVLPSGEKLQEGSIQSAAETAGADAVLITHVVGEETEQRWNPPVYHTVPGYYRGGYYGYYTSVFDYTHSPGYYTSHTILKLETNLYDVESGNMIWSGRSESFDPTSEKQVTRELIRGVVKELSKQGMIAPAG